ncbi:MAG: WbqC family protein [Reichenbachiella sp.]|uniref:WbqC family protein n=1 Tax=Reichenbachiella sp. TaxID=2184521 RepID=UPI00329972F9
MRIAIMQPYFLPYLGYFQLMNLVDVFVIYDEIQYTKKGWINRNRILVNNDAQTITLPLKKDSDYLNIKDRILADHWPKERKKLLAKIYNCYKKAPEFDKTYDLLESIFEYDEQNLFKFIQFSLKQLMSHFNITTSLVVSSDISFDNKLKSSDKVLAICRASEATHYINPIGGLELYDKKQFEAQDVKLNFLRSNLSIYPQFENEFVPGLSVVDAMMFNSPQELSNLIQNDFELV